MITPVVLSRSQALSNIPERKLHEKILASIQACKICSARNKTEPFLEGLCDKCNVFVIAYHRYFEANIPLEFWDRSMSDFKGSPILVKLYQDLVVDIPAVYQNGVAMCLAGLHGIGKSMTISCFLKKACQKNFSARYTTLTDMVAALIEAPNEERFLARRELLATDFLAIDELDPRFIHPNSADLFGRLLEHIFRTRHQNKLPTFFCSNSPNPIEAFSGAIKQSIDSLMSKVKIIPIIGDDFRKTGK